MTGKKPTKPRKKQIPCTFEDIQKRQEALAEIQAKYINMRKKLTRALMLSELKLKGFEPSEGTLTRDLVDISKGNMFVRNIAEMTFSKQVEDISNTLDALEELAWQWLDTPPQIIKQKMIPVGPPDKNGIQQFKVTEQTVETVSLMAISENLKDIVMAKKDLITGDVLNVSVVLLGNKLSHMTEELKKQQEAQPLKKPLALTEVKAEI